MSYCFFLSARSLVLARIPVKNNGADNESSTVWCILLSSQNGAQTHVQEKASTDSESVRERARRKIGANERETEIEGGRKERRKRSNRREEKIKL